MVAVINTVREKALEALAEKVCNMTDKQLLARWNRPLENPDDMYDREADITRGEYREFIRAEVEIRRLIPDEDNSLVALGLFGSSN